VISLSIVERYFHFQPKSRKVIVRADTSISNRTLRDVMESLQFNHSFYEEQGGYRCVAFGHVHCLGLFLSTGVDRIGRSPWRLVMQVIDY